MALRTLTIFFLCIGLLIAMFTTSCGPEGDGSFSIAESTSDTEMIAIPGQIIIGITQSGTASAAGTASSIIPGSKILDHFIQTNPQLPIGAQAAATTGSDCIVALFALPDTMTINEAIDIAEGQAGVVYAEPNYRVFPAFIEPNDPYFPNQWGLQNTGQTLTGDKGTITGLPGADISALSAWQRVTTTSNVVVATIDTGIEISHPDLIDSLWINQGESGLDQFGNDRSINGLDDDLNGYVDDIHGWNFVSNSSDITDDDQESATNSRPLGHGTHVAGIIGATTDNGIGISGVNQKAKIMGIKFLKKDGTAATNNPSQGVYYEALSINYAVQNGAKVINASYTYPQDCISLSPSSTERNALLMAAEAGVLVVAAAGNAGCNNDYTPFYPASHQLDNIVSVAATTPRDEKVSWSNYGRTSVDLAAPGMNIYSTVRMGRIGMEGEAGYDYMSGTSMASPFVAGAASLLLSVHPDLTVYQVRDILIDSVTPLPSLTGTTLSEGRLNIDKALSADPALPAPVPPDQIVLDLARPDQIDISWFDSTMDESSYFIERGDNSQTMAMLTRLDPDAVSFTDTTAPDGTTQSYRLRSFSGIHSTSTGTINVVVPLRPVSSLFLSRLDTGVRVSWSSPSPRVSIFHIERADEVGGTFSEIATAAASQTAYLDATADSSLDYRYRIRVSNAIAGYSDYSPEASTLPPVTPVVTTYKSKRVCILETALVDSTDKALLAQVRGFRQKYLATSWFGRSVVKCYYILSRVTVPFLEDSPFIREAAAKVLRPLMQLMVL